MIRLEVLVQNKKAVHSERLQKTWWRRGELNSCPNPYPPRHLRVQLLIRVFPFELSPITGGPSGSFINTTKCQSFHLEVVLFNLRQVRSAVCDSTRHADITANR